MRGNCRGHTERTKTSEKVRGVAGVRDGEGFGKAVVGDGEAKEFGSDGVAVGVVEGRESQGIWKRWGGFWSGSYT